MFDVKKAKEEAEKELAEERGKVAKEKIKGKLWAIDRAEKVVANLRRELQDLYEELSGG